MSHKKSNDLSKYCGNNPCDPPILSTGTLGTSAYNNNQISRNQQYSQYVSCLLYTSDAADE